MSEGTFRVEGFIDIEIVNKVDKVRRVYSQHNTLTRGGAQMFFANSAGNLLKIAGDGLGQTYCIDNWNSRYQGCNYSKYENTIHNALLNLDDETASNMSANSTFADIYNNEFNSLDKVVGYAGINVNPDNNGREGSIDYSKGEYVVDPYTRAMRWYYKQGVASGTFNCIAMLGRSTLTNNIPMNNGCLFGKILDKTNSTYTNWAKNSTALCPPGIPGITDNDTILLNFKQDNIERWKYSISTGEITQVPDNETFWVPFSYNGNNVYNIVDYFVENGYLYILSMYARKVNNSGYYVAVYNISTQSYVTSYNFGGTGRYVCNCHFLRYNGNVYVTWNSSNEQYTSSSNTYRATKLKSNGSYYNSMTNISDVATELGIIIPAGIDTKLISFGNYGNNYLVSIGEVSITVSSLSDIHGSMIEVIPNLYQGTLPVMTPFYAGSNLGFLSIGCPGSQKNTSGIRLTNNGDAFWWTIMNSPTTEYTSDFTDSGVFIVMDGWWTSLLSFAILNNPITKSDSDEMYISYGYKVVV